MTAKEKKEYMEKWYADNKELNKEFWRIRNKMYKENCEKNKEMIKERKRILGE